MQTYKTYQEAKIANPDSDIYHASKYGFVAGETEVYAANWKKCNPADYCISVAEFKNRGLVLTNGDLYELENGRVFSVGFGDGISVDYDSPANSKRHILRAKALEQTETPEQRNSCGIQKPDWATWDIGDEVSKIKGSQWKGKIVGFYSTELTPKGYAVESSTEKGSVQIYPEQALEEVKTEREAFIEKAFEIHCRDELHEAKEVFAVIYDELVD